MPDTPAAPEELAKQAIEAAEKAEAAAKRAEDSAVGPRFTMGAGLLLALVGAVLAFALKDTHASVLGVSLRPFGGVLFAAGVLLVAGVAIGSMGKGGGGSSDLGGIKAVGGLIAVVVGITAVTALAVVTLTRLGSGNKESIVAVTTSAFGIISAVVGAYLGIKISADTNAKASDEAKHAAVAEHVANVASAERDKAVDLVSPEEALTIRAAGNEASGVGTGPPGPPQGGDVK